MSITAGAKSNIQAGIKRILIDEVDFWIRADGTCLEFTGHCDLGDPFPEFVSLVDKVKCEEDASIEWYDLFRFTRFAIDVRNVVDSDRVQVLARVDTSDLDRESGAFEVECERAFFISVLRELLNGLVDHPDFVHQYVLGWDYLNDEALDNDIDKLWDEMVERGEVEDDYDAEMAFKCKYLREHIPIPEVERTRIDNYLDMLRRATGFQQTE